MAEETALKTQQTPDDGDSQGSLSAWLRLQSTLARKADIALATLAPGGTVIGRVERDSSICEMLKSHPEQLAKCEADCTAAYEKAVGTGRAIEYRCHAGLHCFAIPVGYKSRELVVLGGRVFTSAGEYSEFVTGHGDLPQVRTGECLRNVRFTDRVDLRQASELVASAAKTHFERPTESARAAGATAHKGATTQAGSSREQLVSHFSDFIRGLGSTLDSGKVYASLAAKCAEMMRSGRSSLMVLNEDADELSLEAAVGPYPELGFPVRVKVGEGVAGVVAASGSAMLVRDVESDMRVPTSRRDHYRSRSFISYPIALGPRRIGVINLTDRVDGMAYELDDLSLLERIAPQLALIIDRTEWQRKAEAYQKMSLTDPLTGLPNRRYLEERLFEEVERSKRHGTSLSFMLIDVDEFKSYNDLFGHTNADRVLVRCGQMLRRSIRAIDMAARFGGDEFCIILPETEQNDAVHIAERLRASVARADFQSEKGEAMGRVTLSIGVSSFGSTRQSPLAIIDAADRALYQAKTRGRNCVVTPGEPT